MLRYMKSKALIDKVNSEIYYYEPLLASIYISLMSLGGFFKFVIDENSIFIFLSKYLKKLAKRNPTIVESIDRGTLDSTVLGRLLSITEKPYEILENIETHYMSLIEVADQNKILLEKLDEKISLVIFVNFFLPFAILFISVLEVEHILLFLALYPLMNVALIYFTIKILFEEEYLHGEKKS